MFQWMKTQPVLGLAAILGLSAILSAWVGGQSLIAMKRLDQNVLTVTGSAQTHITSDQASWQCRFSRQADRMPIALSALQGDLSRVLAYLQAAGLTSTNWTVQPVETTVLYVQTASGNTTNTVEGYRLSQTVLVEQSDVGKITRLAQGADRLMAQGVTLDNQPPAYFYTRLDALKVDMLGKATRDARQRAEQMAGSAGSHIGPLRSAQMGVFQITAPRSTDVTDSGVNDTSTVDKQVTAVVNATFTVQ